MLGTCAVGIQRRRRTCPVISRLITSTYLCISCDAKSFWPPWLRRCLCVLFFRVTCSLLEGSRVHREQNPHPLETHQLYSRLISCTRKVSTLHLEFKCECCLFILRVPSFTVVQREAKRSPQREREGTKSVLPADSRLGVGEAVVDIVGGLRSVAGKSDQKSLEKSNKNQRVRS